MRKVILSLSILGLSIAFATPEPAYAAQQSSCPKYENLLAKYRLPVKRFSRIMQRESNCNPHARSKTRDSGLLQINDIWHKALRKKFGVRGSVIGWLMVPENNVKAARFVYVTQGIGAWATA